MFSSEINISVTADSRGSGLFGLDLSAAACNLSEGGFESMDALLDERRAISSAGRKKKRRETRTDGISIENEEKLQRDGLIISKLI